MKSGPAAYVTQIGPDGSGHDRCGAACVASILLSAGWDSDPYGLMLDVTRQLWGGREPGGATAEQLGAVLLDYGFLWAHWVTWLEAAEALGQGHYVLALVDNRLLAPRAYPRGDAWNALHWLRIVDLIPDDEMAYVYDPLTYIPQADGSIYQGPTVARIPTIRAGIAATPEPYAGILVWR